MKVLNDKNVYEIMQGLPTPAALKDEISVLCQTARTLAEIYDRELFVETAFPFSRTWKDDQIDEIEPTMGQTYRFIFRSQRSEECSTYPISLPSSKFIRGMIYDDARDFANYILGEVFCVSEIDFDTSEYDSTDNRDLINWQDPRSVAKLADRAVSEESDSIIPGDPITDWLDQRVADKLTDGPVDEESDDNKLNYHVTRDQVGLIERKQDWLDELVQGLKDLEAKYAQTYSGFHLRLYSSLARSYRYAKDGITRKALLPLKEKPLAVSFYVDSKPVGKSNTRHRIHLEHNPSLYVANLLDALDREIEDVFLA